MIVSGVKYNELLKFIHVFFVCAFFKVAARKIHITYVTLILCGRH